MTTWAGGRSGGKDGAGVLACVCFLYVFIVFVFVLFFADACRGHCLILWRGGVPPERVFGKKSLYRYTVYICGGCGHKESVFALLLDIPHPRDFGRSGCHFDRGDFKGPAGRVLFSSVFGVRCARLLADVLGCGARCVCVYVCVCACFVSRFVKGEATVDRPA